MAETLARTQLDEVLAELAALDNAKVREANGKRGDDHGVNLGQLRAVAKRLKTQQDLAVRLWGTGDTAAAAGVAGVQAEVVRAERAGRDAAGGACPEGA